MKERPLIVVAEDETDAALLLDYHLRRAGYRTAVVPDGLGALNAAFERKPALVLLDWMMPKLDGLQVCRLLKTSPLTRQIPVILVTARGLPEDKLKGFGHGADDYLTKPYEMEELLARVARLLTPRPQHEPVSLADR